MSKSFHGSQGMDSDGRSLGMGPDSSGSQASFSAMIEEIFSSEHAVSSPGPAGQTPSSRKPVPRVNPDSSCEVARLKVMKLEKALEVMGDTDGPVVVCLKEELEKARNVAKQRPLQQEVEECRKFITRSEKRISELDAERSSEMKALDEAKERLVRLEAEQAEVPKVVSSVQEAVPPVDWAAEVQIARGIDASARRSQSHSCTILPKFFRGCQHAAGEGCKTSCRSCRVSAHQFTRCGTVEMKETFGAPRCHPVWGQRVDSGGDGSHAARCSAIPQFAFHSEQHGCVRIVAHQCGWLGCRVGEVANPGPASRRRRMLVLGQRHRIR